MTVRSPTALAVFSVTEQGYPTTVQLSYQDARRRGLTADPLVLPWADRYAASAPVAVHFDGAARDLLLALEKSNLTAISNAIVAAVDALKVATPEADYTILDAAVEPLVAATA